LNDTDNCGTSVVAKLRKAAFIELANDASYHYVLRRRCLRSEDGRAYSEGLPTENDVTDTSKINGSVKDKRYNTTGDEHASRTEGNSTVTLQDEKTSHEAVRLYLKYSLMVYRSTVTIDLLYA
jgi:hypothetical protein